MTSKEVLLKARTTGSARVAQLAGVTQDAASRYITGAVNPDLEAKLRDIWTKAPTAGAPRI